MSESQPESESKPDLKPVFMFNEHETIIQISQFGNSSFVCLTSANRVLVPGLKFGEWFELPLPPSFPSTE